MYGVLGEDTTDAETVKAIIERILKPGASINVKGFGGKDELLAKGANHVNLLYGLGYRKFIVCHDSDGPDPSISRDKVEDQVVKRCGVPNCCIVIPVHMIEAWILADVQAVSHVIKSWRPGPISNPESYPNPKLELERLSRQENRRPRYSHETHNPKIAKYLDPNIVLQKCPSFRPLYDFIKST